MKIRSTCPHHGTSQLPAQLQGGCVCTHASLLGELGCWWLFLFFIYEITHHWYVICFCKIMKQTRCYEYLVPKKSLIQSCDTWPAVLMSAWVLPQSKRKFMPKSHVRQEHTHLKHTEAAFEKKHRLQLKHSIWKARDQFLTWPHKLCIASPSYLSILFPSSPKRNGRTFS